MASKTGRRGPNPAKGRSRITNGQELLPGVDKRTVWARRFRDLVGLHASDLGGSDSLSEAQKAIIRRAAALSVELETMERKFALAGGASDLQLLRYGRAANTQRRLLQSIGMERRAKSIPTLQQYLAQREIQLEANEEAEEVSDD